MSDFGGLTDAERRRMREQIARRQEERMADETLAMMRALDSVPIDDYENEPPDFTVTDDDLGFGEA